MTTTLPRPKLTLAQSLKVIRADGQGIEQQPWNMLWHVWYDTPPSNRNMKSDLTEAEVIEYAELIIYSYR